MVTTNVPTTRGPVIGPSVWHADDHRDRSAWTIKLNAEQRREIAAEATAAVDVCRSITTLLCTDLALRSLDPIIERTRAALSAYGFVLLRGFPVEELSEAAPELAYLGLGLRLGTPVGQDAHASLLGHVRDEPQPRTGPHIRLYRTHERQEAWDRAAAEPVVRWPLMLHTGTVARRHAGPLGVFASWGVSASEANKSPGPWSGGTVTTETETHPDALTAKAPGEHAAQALGGGEAGART